MKCAICRVDKCFWTELHHIDALCLPEKNYSPWMPVKIDVCWECLGWPKPSTVEETECKLTLDCST